MSLRLLSRRALAATSFALLLPLAAQAESSFQSGAGTLTANARLDFRVTIPGVLFLRVGTGTGMTTVGTVDLIDFTVPAANVGDGTDIAATAGSGDLLNGTVTASLFSNKGNVTLSSTTLGALNNGAGDTISFSQILATAAVLTSATALPHPTLADGATTSSTITAVGKIVNRDARWTFAYDNSVTPAPGTYGGVNVNNGRVTYTAATP